MLLALASDHVPVFVADPGTWSDANASNTVILSASIGAVTKSGTNASGTWSWSFGTTDGPDQSQTVTITANDGTTSTSTTFSLTVNNVAPTATFPATRTVDEGSSSSFAFTSPSDPSSADTTAGFHYAFDCTGASLATATYAGSGTSASASCSFGDGPGSQTVRARIIDKDGGFTEYTTAVTITNVAPTATFTNNGPVNEGSSFTLSMDDGDDVSSADKAAKFTFAFDCGDGSGYGAFTATATLSASQSCPTDDNGSRSVKAKIRDKDGGVREYTGSVTVNNVDPSATFNAPTEVDEGSDINISLSDVVDPGTADTHQYRFKCGAGDWTAYGASASHACPTTDNGTVTVKGECGTTTAARASSTALTSPSTTSILRPPSTPRRKSTRARTSTSPSPTSSIRARPTRTSTASSAAPATGPPTALRPARLPDHRQRHRHRQGPGAGRRRRRERRVQR